MKEFYIILKCSILTIFIILILYIKGEKINEKQIIFGSLGFVAIILFFLIFTSFYTVRTGEVVLFLVGEKLQE